MNADGQTKAPQRRSHDWLDQRSLALERAAAEVLRGKPELINRVKSTLARWIQQREPDVPQCLRNWQQILDHCTLDEILQWMTREDAEATRLRQSSPFCGILTEDQRLSILRQYEALRA